MSEMVLIGIVVIFYLFISNWYCSWSHWVDVKAIMMWCVFWRLPSSRISILKISQLLVDCLENWWRISNLMTISFFFFFFVKMKYYSYSLMYWLKLNERYWLVSTPKYIWQKKFTRQWFVYLQLSMSVSKGTSNLLHFYSTMMVVRMLYDQQICVHWLDRNMYLAWLRCSSMIFSLWIH